MLHAKNSHHSFLVFLSSSGQESELPQRNTLSLSFPPFPECYIFRVCAQGGLAYEVL